ncbi:hypothetical protein [Pseudomonas umsongensis]|uniref:hypothetical protein n=1 Tax=Pseudomonas umsongensis TaxID=198618 RepID=UPI00200AECFF|nr:hypothetical protein [Pseudomonas umsongensis]MCK8655614.1 hypothetical protein [Pseudomonas umsongensis]
MTAPWTKPAPLPDIPGGEINLLHRSAWADPNKPLRVEFKPWYEVEPKPGVESVSVFLDDDEKNEIGFGKWNVPMDPGDYFVEISADNLPQGKHTISFIMTNYLGVAARSFPYTVTIDKQATLLNADSQLIFPPEVSPPPKEIDAFFLARPENQDRVLARLPVYSEPKVGDVITRYWEEFPDSVNEVDTLTLELSDIGNPLMLTFSGQMLRDRGNGPRYATYRVRDRAGNESLPSANVRLQVNIQPPPLRKHPTVKEAQNGPGTGVLDPRLYGVSGVTVVIPKQEDEDKEFKREVFWKGNGEEGSHHALLPNPSNKSEFLIPAKAIPPNIGAGRIVEIIYTVDTAGSRPEPSDPLKLTVKPIAVQDFNPPIDCPLAARGTPLKLKLASVPDDGTPLVLQPWVYQAQTQLINIWLTDSNSREEYIRSAYPVVTGVNRAMLPKTFLQGVRINSIFAVHVSVSFDGGDSYLLFPTQDMQLLG